MLVCVLQKRCNDIWVNFHQLFWSQSAKDYFLPPKTCVCARKTRIKACNNTRKCISCHISPSDTLFHLFAQLLDTCSKIYGREPTVLSLALDVLKKFRFNIYEIFTHVSLSIISDFKRIECYTWKPDALAQSGFVYTSYAAATTDVGMHVSGYVAGSW